MTSPEKQHGDYTGYERLRQSADRIQTTGRGNISLTKFCLMTRRVSTLAVPFSFHLSPDMLQSKLVTRDLPNFSLSKFASNLSSSIRARNLLASTASIKFFVAIESSPLR